MAKNDLPPLPNQKAGASENQYQAADGNSNRPVDPRNSSALPASPHQDQAEYKERMNQLLNNERFMSDEDEQDNKAESTIMTILILLCGLAVLGASGFSLFLYIQGRPNPNTGTPVTTTDAFLGEALEDLDETTQDNIDSTEPEDTNQVTYVADIQRFRDTFSTGKYKVTAEGKLDFTEELLNDSQESLQFVDREIDTSLSEKEVLRDTVELYYVDGNLSVINRMEDNLAIFLQYELNDEAEDFGAIKDAILIDRESNKYLELDQNEAIVLAAFGLLFEEEGILISHALLQDTEFVEFGERNLLLTQLEYPGRFALHDSNILLSALYGINASNNLLDTVIYLGTDNETQLGRLIFEIEELESLPEEFELENLLEEFEVGDISDFPEISNIIEEAISPN